MNKEIRNLSKKELKESIETDKIKLEETSSQISELVKKEDKLLMNKFAKKIELIRKEDLLSKIKWTYQPYKKHQERFSITSKETIKDNKNIKKVYEWMEKPPEGDYSTLLQKGNIYIGMCFVLNSKSIYNEDYVYDEDNTDFMRLTILVDDYYLEKELEEITEEEKIKSLKMLMDGFIKDWGIKDIIIPSYYM